MTTDAAIERVVAVVRAEGGATYARLWTLLVPREMSDERLVKAIGAAVDSGRLQEAKAHPYEGARYTASKGDG